MTDQDFPSDMVAGGKYPVCNVGMKEGKTEPPPYLSEADLIELMETVGAKIFMSECDWY